MTDEACFDSVIRGWQPGLKDTRQQCAQPPSQGCRHLPCSFLINREHRQATGVGKNGAQAA